MSYHWEVLRIPIDGNVSKTVAGLLADGVQVVAMSTYVDTMAVTAVAYMVLLTKKEAAQDAVVGG